MKYLNKILIKWNNSDTEDTGLFKISDINNRMKPQLVYKIDEQRRIKIFDGEEYLKSILLRNKFKDKVYINDEYVQLEDGYTVNEYEPGEYRVYIEDFDKIEEIDDLAFFDTGLISIIIPNSVTKIGEQVFEYCSSLASVTIPNSVTEIGDYAFNGCTGLTSITIPNSITTIPYYCFHCAGLTSITIPNSVTTIDEGAFRSCIGLTSITIPNSVTTIGPWAFFNCKKLKKVYVEDIKKFNQLCAKTHNWAANPTCYGAKLIELKK